MVYCGLRTIFLAMTLMSVLGCMVVVPKTTDLSAIHAIYRREFIQAALPEAASLRPGASTPQGLRAGSFTETLAAIADYRRKYPAAQPELSHLLILEGMIYLQSRQFGLARLMTAEVQAAGTKLSSAASAPRDSLFAAVFPLLVDGWEVIARHEMGAANLNDQPQENGQKLATAANSLTQQLCVVKNTGALHAVAGDQGASYVATTGAIFYFWADHTASFRCNVRKEEEVCTALYKPSTYLERGRDLLWTFLPPQVQRALQEDAVAEQEATVDGGLRFVEHYRALQQSIVQRAAQFPEFPVSPYQDPCKTG